MKVKLHQPDKAKTYFLMPQAYEVDRLEEDMVFTHQGKEMTAPAGHYLLSQLGGPPQAVVSPQDFERHYQKAIDLPRGVNRALQKVFKWKIGQAVKQ